MDTVPWMYGQSIMDAVPWMYGQSVMDTVPWMFGHSILGHSTMDVSTEYHGCMYITP